MGNEQELLTREERLKFAIEDEIPVDDHTVNWSIEALLKAQVAKLKAMSWKSPEEVERIKVRGLEAGKILGAKQERERIFKEAEARDIGDKFGNIYIPKSQWQALKEGK